MPTHAEPFRGDGRTILLVEDESALIRVITRILADAGYQVLAATNGPEALELVGEQDCDLLLTDVVMPEMSGCRLAEVIHEERPDLPVLFMSGYSNGLLSITHILDDGIAFIEKPSPPTDSSTKSTTSWAPPQSPRRTNPPTGC